MHVFDLKQLATFDSAKPKVQILAKSGHARQVLFSFRAGQGLKEHTTSSQIAVQVMSGALTFAARDESRVLEAGTLVVLEANVPHSVEAQSDVVMLLTLTPDPQSHSLAAELWDRIEPIVRV